MFWNIKTLKEESICWFTINYFIILTVPNSSAILFAGESDNYRGFLKDAIKHSQDSLDYSKTLLLPTN